MYNKLIFFNCTIYLNTYQMSIINTALLDHLILLHLLLCQMSHVHYTLTIRLSIVHVLLLERTPSIVQSLCKQSKVS